MGFFLERNLGRLAWSVLVTRHSAFEAAMHRIRLAVLGIAVMPPEHSLLANRFRGACHAAGAADADLQCRAHGHGFVAVRPAVRTAGQVRHG